jgi:hypothetical protein
MIINFHSYHTKHVRQDGTKGSNNSGSRNLQRNRSVAPLIYSFGCCKSFLNALLKELNK